MLEELIVTGITRHPSVYGVKGLKASSITENVLRKENGQPPRAAYATPSQAAEMGY